MKTAECQEVFYPGSTYVWCKGESSVLGRHPIFVSSPVKFMSGPSGLCTLQTCRQASCSLCGETTRYEEKELGFQDSRP
jgi:hypothetical protein